MTAEDVEMKEGPPVEIVPFPTISILQLVKDAQQQHGLRHGDYNRYKIYCKDKLYRVRHALKVQNTHKCIKKHKAKFTKRPIADDLFVDERYLQIPLFEVERRWAQAMHAKTELEDNPQSRKRHMMRSCLKRAAQHVVGLETIVKASPRCDASTKLECSAYATWLRGIVAFEFKQWNEASEALKTAKGVYEKLAEATNNSILATLYRSKCREIQPQLRLCEFNSADSGAPKASIGELMHIREQMGGDSGEIDQLIAEIRSKATTNESVYIEWGGEKSAVSDERAKAVIEGWAQTDKDIKDVKDPKEKMALLEKQLGDTRDAIEKLSESQKKKQAEGTAGMAVEEASRLRAYLDYLRLSRTAERYLAIIENTKQEKKVRPQDLLRLYDSVIEIFKEVTMLEGANDKQLQQAYHARIEFYRTFRCFYMAASYALLGKHNEAVVLFDRASERMTAAEKLLAAIPKGNQYVVENAAALSALSEELERARVAARAAQMAEAAGVGIQKMEIGEQLDNRTLMESLDDFRDWDLTRVGASVAAAKKKQDKKEKEPAAVPIARFPPAPLPMPVKPMFFDLALNHIKMPDLEERIAKTMEGQKETPKKAADTKGAAPSQEESKGISGVVSGWFWGKK